jgi:hypothetical protein
MRWAALPLSWELWWRVRRWSLPALAYLAALAVLSRAVATGHLEPVVGAQVLGVAMLLPAHAYLLLFVLVVYPGGTTNLEVDLAARGSGFPARKFALPVPTAALVFWPMFYGMLGAGLLWVMLATLLLRPCGLDPALLWPALLVASFTGWLQVVAWWPFGWPWVRVFLALLLLGVVVAAPPAYEAYQVSPPLMAGVLAPLLPAAYLTAVAGVARARRGDGTEWPSPARLLGRLVPALPRRRRPFASAAWALLWWEWRRNAVVVLVLLAFSYTAFLVPPLLVGNNEVLPLRHTLPSLLLAPFLVGWLGGAGLGKPDYRERAPGLSSFLATRPVTATAVVAAKLKAAGLLTLAAWALAALLAPLTLARADYAAEAARWWGLFLQAYPAWKACAIVAAAVVGLMALTWRGLVVNLYVCLTGRPWVAGVGVSIGAALLFALPFVGQWVSRHPESPETLRRLLPWLAGAAVALKGCLAGWALRALYRRRLVAPSALAGLLAAWLLAVASLFAVLAWLLPRAWVSPADIALGVVLVVPLARLALAPLALEWNRHR